MAEGQTTFVDTNVLAHAHDRSETRKQPVAHARLEVLWRDRTGALSTQVLQEFLHRRHPEARRADASARRAGATRLLTEGLQPGRRIGGVRIENPFV